MGVSASARSRCHRLYAGHCTAVQRRRRLAHLAEAKLRAHAAAMRGCVASACAPAPVGHRRQRGRLPIASELLKTPQVRVPAAASAAASSAWLGRVERAARRGGTPPEVRPARRAPRSVSASQSRPPSPRTISTCAPRQSLALQLLPTTPRNRTAPLCGAVRRTARPGTPQPPQRLRSCRGRSTPARTPAGQRCVARQAARRRTARPRSGSRTSPGAARPSTAHACVHRSSRSATARCQISGSAAASMPASRSRATHSAACGCGPRDEHAQRHRAAVQASGQVGAAAPARVQQLRAALAAPSASAAATSADRRRARCAAQQRRAAVCSA